MKRIEPTPEALKKAESFAKSIYPIVDSLAQRWADESQYEDFADYIKPLQKPAKDAGVTLTKMNKKPFGVLFTVDEVGHVFEVRVKGNRISLFA
jgi:hypothetical protein